MWYGKYDTESTEAEFCEEIAELRTRVERLQSTNSHLEKTLFEIQHPFPQKKLDKILDSWDRDKDFENMTGLSLSE